MKNSINTTCQLDPREHGQLLKTGNFGGAEGWYSGQVRNLPPQQTAANTFESDVTGMTPISPVNKDSSPGFIPTSSFESDVMGITPKYLTITSCFQFRETAIFSQILISFQHIDLSVTKINDNDLFYIWRIDFSNHFLLFTSTTNKYE